VGRSRGGAPRALPGAGLTFDDVIRRQLDLFEQESTDLIAECDAAARAYDAAGRDEAEERYAAYLELVETGTARLAELRDNFASTMTESAAEEYEHEFNAAVQKQLPRFSLQIEDL
jgi:hypothetical protein